MNTNSEKERIFRRTMPTSSRTQETLLKSPLTRAKNRPNLAANGPCLSPGKGRSQETDDQSSQNCQGRPQTWTKNGTPIRGHKQPTEKNKPKKQTAKSRSKNRWVSIPLTSACCPFLPPPKKSLCSPPRFGSSSSPPPTSTSSVPRQI